MIYKTVHYKVRREKLAAVRQAVIEFISGIAEYEPQTRYEAFQADDEVSFFHFMAFSDQAAETYHQNAPHTLKFVDVLYPSCEDAPEFTNLTEVKITRPE